VNLGGAHRADLVLPPLSFRHIAHPDRAGEVSGHYHPKARLRMRGRSLARPAFLIDGARVILPAYGTYTGGLRSEDAPLSDLMQAGAVAVLTGRTAHAVPMPRNRDGTRWR
jgi:metallophosphoesterase superfamily enzyme